MKQPLPLPVAQVQEESSGLCWPKKRDGATNHNKPSPVALGDLRPEAPMKQLGGAHFPHGVLGYWGQEARVVNQDWVLCEHLGVQK